MIGKQASKPKLAFSLIELSVMILILSIISVGMLPMVKNTKVIDKFQITNQRIKTIYRSLSSFVATNKRLPCPAVLTISKGDAGYGNETATQGTCTGAFTSTSATNLAYGMVPITALNLPIELAEDGWGNKFEYVVDKRFTTRTKDENDNQGFEYQQTLTYPGGPALPAIINIYDGLTVSNSTALFVILSHGANGYKSWPSDATTQNTTSGTNPDEPKNSRDENTNNFDNSFYASSATINTNFDDILLYKTKQQLVQDAGMEFIRCSALDGQIKYPLTLAADKTTWGDCDVTSTANFKNAMQGTNGNYPCDPGCRNGQPSLTMTRYCDKYGVWAGSVANQCKKDPVLPSYNRVFLSSVAYDGNLGGVAGADAKCTTLANNAGLGGGPWIAWVSTAASPVKNRIINRARPYRSVYSTFYNTTLIANNWADLTDGTIQNMLYYDEYGRWWSISGVVYYVRTATAIDGSYDKYFTMEQNCGNWTDSSSGNFYGSANLTNREWTTSVPPVGSNYGASYGSCGELSAIYCFEDRP